MVVSKEVREIIVKLFKQKCATQKIANTVKASVWTVRRVVKQYQETGDVTPGEHPGRPRKLTSREERALARMMIKDPFTRPKELETSIINLTGKKISEDTVRRTLHREGLHPHRPVRKPALTKAQREARLKWAKEYAKKPAKFWDTVTFSDETTAHVQEAYRGKWVWRFDHQELDPRFVQQTKKFGGGQLKVWSCITSRGVGWMRGLPQGLNSPTYVAILKRELAYTIRHYFGPFKGVLFQQDGAGEHRGGVVLDYLETQSYRVLDWPAHSPDLSPIENLWADLKRRLDRNHPDLTKKTLWEVTEREWDSTSPALIKALYESIPARLQAVIKAKSGYTHY